MYNIFRKGKKLLKVFRKLLPATFEDCKIPVHVTTFRVDLADKKVVRHESGDLPLAVRASMSIPFLFDPVAIDDGLHIDGGWQANFPLPEDSDADVVGLYFGLDARPKKKIPINNNLDLGMALIDGAIDESMRHAI